MTTVTYPLPPRSLEFKPDSIPNTMRELNHWVVWRSEWKSKTGKWDKPPRQINGDLAESNNPTTWTRFSAVAACALNRSKWSGIGFVVGGGIIGSDLDGCRDKDGNMRPDGSILQTPGYDYESGILYTPRRKYPEIVPWPMADDVSVAVDAIDEVIADFPFERDEHRAAWFAAMLTPIARFAFDGPAPLFLVDANVRGAGKGLAVDCAGIIATGERLATASYSHDDAEMRKAITSIAMAGDRAVLLDNIGGSFGVPCLDAALTSTKWKDRVLGGNQTIDLPLLVTWYATGNNVILAGDIPRRICHVRLNSPEEALEEREGFHHADLRNWLHREHPRLLAAALTILRGYIAAGRPDMKLKSWGTYEEWSALVRNALVWLGLPDPGATRQELAKTKMKLPAELKPEAITAIIDTREQLPLDLSPLCSIRDTLTTGDYSVRGLEHLVALERKSLGDLLACVGRERERFDREVQRLLAYPARALVIESTWPTLEAGNWHGEVTPSAALGSVLGWIAAGSGV